MTVITDTRPAPPSRAQLERASQLVAELLKGRSRGSVTYHAAVSALSRAIAVTPPKSEHGRLLFRTLRSLQDRGAGPKAADESAVWWLAQRGQTPTPGAVAARLAAAGTSRQAAAAVGVVTGQLGDDDGARAADAVAGVIARTGAGPTWRELAIAMGWPLTPHKVQFAAVSHLVAMGWLQYGTTKRSLRPGPKARRPQ
jgi:hypothetical protein